MSICSFAQQLEQPGDDLKAFASWFDSQMTGLSPIYYGESYPLVMRARFGHQFYDSRQWKNGTISIDDQYYFDLPLLFDIEDQQLVLRNPDPTLQAAIKLDMDRLAQFTLDSTRFIRLQSGKRNVFYEVIVDGFSLDLLATNMKELQLKSDGYYYEYSKKYFLHYNHRLIPLRTKAALKELPQDVYAATKNVKGARLKLRKEESLIAYFKELDEIIH